MNRLTHASLFRRVVVLHRVEMTKVNCDEKRFLKLDFTAVLLDQTRMFVYSKGERPVNRRFSYEHLALYTIYIVEFRYYCHYVPFILPI